MLQTNVSWEHNFIPTSQVRYFAYLVKTKKNKQNKTEKNKTEKNKTKRKTYMSQTWTDMNGKCNL